MKMKTLHYLGSINCINACIRGYNYCQTGIELSKCVYGCENKPFSWRSKSRVFSKCIFDGHASRHRGHNQRKTYENVCFCPSKPNGIYGKLNKIGFGRKFCRICPLGSLPAPPPPPTPPIIIDVFYQNSFFYMNADQRVCLL